MSSSLPPRLPCLAHSEQHTHTGGRVGYVKNHGETTRDFTIRPRARLPSWLNIRISTEEKNKRVSVVITTARIVKLDSQATTTKDTRSKNYWLHASTGHNAEKIAKLAKAITDLGDFAIRDIVSGSPEERQIQHHIIKSLELTTDTPNDGTGRTSREHPTGTNANESQQNLTTDQSRQDRSPATTNPELEEPDLSTSNPTSRPRDEQHGVMTTRRSSRHHKAEAPPPPSSLDEQPLTNRSRGKRTATSAFSDPDRVPATGPSRPAIPKISPSSALKRVKFNLDLNTFKFFEEWDDLEPLPSSSNTRGALTTAPTVKDLPSTCLRSIFIYGTPDPTITLAKTYRSALYGLMAVCKKWKIAAESTPSLWSHLSNSSPPGMLDACIQRSSGVAITVHFDGSMEYPSTVQSALDKFVDKVTPHRLRWRSLWINDVPPTWSSYLAIARAFGGSAPALKSAEVTTIHGTTMPFVHSLRCFSGDAGTLRHVALTGIVPKLGDLPIFAKVETLRVIRPLGICPAYLLRILARTTSYVT
ncbi:hypothetical protein FRC05_007902 [Tulasnella sp. 425]|nr:hypothetical protein FRC05_007902 [Tulasnella sp. 425]